MGTGVNVAGALLGAGMSKAAERAAVAALKRGKSKEQKAVINFFLPPTGCLRSLLSKVTVMSYQEYLQKVAAYCNSRDFRQMAMERLGLDESQLIEIDPICLTSYVYDDDVLTRTDKTQLEATLHGGKRYVVSSKYSITWLFFTDTQMYAYDYEFDMISDDVIETAKEFFYQDITCFETSHEIVERIRHKGCLRKGCLKSGYYKDNYYVDKLHITVPGYSYSVYIKDSEEINQRLMAVKAMLRERKFANK